MPKGHEHTNIYVMLNDGNGNFSDGPVTDLGGKKGFYGLAVGDVDGDGDPDAFISNAQGSYSVWGADARVYLNDGTGQFIDSGDRYYLWGWEVGLNDLDADGDLDAVLGTYSPSYDGWTNVMINQGGPALQEWNWSFDTTDGPAESRTVTITATDSDGASSQTTFSLVVRRR